MEELEDLDEPAAPAKSFGYYVGLFVGLFVILCALGFILLSGTPTPPRRPAAPETLPELVPIPDPSAAVLQPGNLLVTVQVARADDPDLVWTKTYSAAAFVEKKDELGQCYLLMADMEAKLKSPAPSTVPFRPAFTAYVVVPCPPSPAVKKLRR